MLEVIAALIPPTAVALLFWFIVRAMVHADRRERIAIARLDAEERARGGDSPPDASATPQQDNRDGAG